MKTFIKIPNLNDSSILISLKSILYLEENKGRNSTEIRTKTKLFETKLSVSEIELLISNAKYLDILTENSKKR